MMDPVTATVGLVGGVGTIVGLIGKSVSTLNTLRVHVSDAELNIELLIGQLQTVQAALRQVQAFLASLSAPFGILDQQLILDLDRSLSHCKLLVQYIDNQISKFAWSPGCRITGQRLLTLIAEDKATKSCLTRLDHQISALNLCLTAFRCRSTSPRVKTHDPEVSYFNTDEDDSEASTVCDDKALARTSSASPTGSSRAQSPTSLGGVSPAERKMSIMSALEARDKSAKSARLDSIIKADAVKRHNQLRVLALGHKRSTLVKQLRLRLGEKLDAVERETYRKKIVTLTASALLTVAKYVEDLNGGFVSDQSRKALEMVQQFSKSELQDCSISEEVALAAKSLWQNWFVQQAFQVMNQDCTSAYFLRSTARIIHPAYVPSSGDIIKTPEQIQTIRDTTLPLDSLTVTLVEPPHSTLSRTLNQFEDIEGCVAYVDISCYDEYVEEDDEATALQRTLNYFKVISRTGWFKKKAVLLCIGNTASFRRKLPVSPLNAYFPQYNGSKDANLATQFMLAKCKQSIAAEFLYTHFAETEEDETTVHFFKTKAEGLRTALELTRQMGFFASTNVVPMCSSKTRNRSI